MPPDRTRPLIAACLVCRRPLLYGVLAAGTWVTTICRHCRLVHPG